jgi:UDP-glucose 4-epimerase
MTRYLVVGGAGFIGSHVTTRLLDNPDPDLRVRVFDNLVSGSRERLAQLEGEGRLELIVGDIKQLDDLLAAAAGIDHVFHFAANPDIAASVQRPDIDFWEGTYLANNVLEAIRRQGVTRLTYASGSGVYGDIGDVNATEDHGPMHPISTYGASKLGCEAMISSYCHMFGLHAAVFRFANVVGPRQTHGVTFDFVRKLLRDPARLEIFGDGSQSKSYIHVDDVVEAILLIAQQQPPGYEVFNVGTDEYVTVREIADLVVETLGLHSVQYDFSGGSRGWKGDVPVVRFSSERVRARGWRNRFGSAEALTASIVANLQEAGGLVGEEAHGR